MPIDHAFGLNINTPNDYDPDRLSREWEELRRQYPSLAPPPTDLPQSGGPMMPQAPGPSSPLLDAIRNPQLPPQSASPPQAVPPTPQPPEDPLLPIGLSARPEPNQQEGLALRAGNDRTLDLIEKLKAAREQMAGQAAAGQLPGQIQSREDAMNQQAARTGAFGGRIGGLPIGQQAVANAANDAFYATSPDMNPGPKQKLDAQWALGGRQYNPLGVEDPRAEAMAKLRQIVEGFDPRARQQEMMRGSGQFAIPRGDSNELPSGTRVEKNERGGIRLVGKTPFSQDPEYRREMASRKAEVEANRANISHNRAVSNLEKRQFGKDPRRAHAASALLDKIRGGPAGGDDLGSYIRQVGTLNIPDNLKSALILQKQKQMGEEKLAAMEIQAALAKAGGVPAAPGDGGAKGGGKPAGDAPSKDGSVLDPKAWGAITGVSGMPSGLREKLKGAAKSQGAGDNPVQRAKQRAKRQTQESPVPPEPPEQEVMSPEEIRAWEYASPFGG